MVLDMACCWGCSLILLLLVFWPKTSFGLELDLVFSRGNSNLF